MSSPGSGPGSRRRWATPPGDVLVLPRGPSLVRTSLSGLISRSKGKGNRRACRDPARFPVDFARICRGSQQHLDLRGGRGEEQSPGGGRESRTTARLTVDIRGRCPWPGVVRELVVRDDTLLECQRLQMPGATHPKPARDATRSEVGLSAPISARIRSIQVDASAHSARRETAIVATPARRASS